MVHHSKLNNFILASLLLILSISISLSLGEVLVRMIIDPVDYLQVYLVDDEILGHRISSSTSGYDSWGFRNTSVPASAKLVAIGDSQTYGTSTSTNSWPSKLQKLRNEQVYNLSLGGYGPVQYYHLLKTKALELNPILIIVGFYFGNDVVDAYDIAYTKEYWKYLRRADFTTSDKQHSEIDGLTNVQHGKLLGSFRNWLAHHSVLYRMFTTVFDGMFRFFEMKYGYSEQNSSISILDDRERNIQTGFTPLARLGVLNLEDPKVREGLRLTLNLFREMKQLSSINSVEFVVAMIPTKESVFADYIGNNGKIKNSDAVNQLLYNERQIKELMSKHFDEHNIPYVDLLPALQTAVPTKTIYPQSEDGHPNAAGYEVIATAIQDSLARRKQ